MEKYLDKNVPWEDIVSLKTGLTQPAAGFEPHFVREKLLKKEEEYTVTQILRYIVRPFDSRWCYYSGVNPLWNRPRPSLYKQLFPGNSSNSNYGVLSV
jgi:hypothetical protein